MGLTNLKRIRPILLTGKTGTGKSTKAKTFVSDDPVVFYANDIGYDIGSVSIDRGIIIEDIHIKPSKEEILLILRTYQGQVVITSINEKDVPKTIKAMCQIKRAGSTNYLEEQIKTVAPRSEKPSSLERNSFDLMKQFLKCRDRDKVRELLHFNKPKDYSILSYLTANINIPPRITFIDGIVKRKWHISYFYDLLAYSFSGHLMGRINTPQWTPYPSRIPYLSRKLGVKEPKVLHQLLEDEDFRTWARTKLNNSDSRLLKLGEKKKRKKKKPITIKQKSIFEYGENKNEV